MRKTTITLLFGLTVIITGYCQKGPARYFGEPIVTDSLSTLFIPTRYNQEFLSLNKIAFWGDYYANIVAYDFKKDTYKKLFEDDIFIEAFRSSNYGSLQRSDGKLRNITSKWVILLAKTKDTNGSGRIDEKDPSVLFAVSTNGQTLKQLTNETENVVSFESFDKQGFVLIEVQRDSNNDKSFKLDDKEFYYRKINLNDLSLGNSIEIK